MKTSSPRNTLCLVGVAVVALGLASPAAEPEPTFYAPFDGEPSASIANGKARASVIQQVSYVEGVKGQAVVCGEKGYLVFMAEQNFNPKSGALSVWVRPVDWEDGDGKFHFMFAAGSENPDTRERLLLYKYSTNAKLTVYCDGPAGKNARVIQKALDDWDAKTWRHYVLCWSPTKLVLYIDGEASGETARTEPAADDWKYFAIGRDGFTPEGDHCAFDELRLYAQPLTPEQVTALFKQDRGNLKKKPMSNSPVTDPSNVARLARGALCLASSTQAGAPVDAAKALDGNPDTGWRAQPGTAPDWYEVRWTVPLPLAEIRWREAEPPAARKLGVEVWNDGEWRSVKEIVRPAATARWEEVALPATPIARVRLVFRELFPGEGRPFASSLRDLVVTARQPFTAEESEPYWQGYWIWYPDGGMNHVTRYFRKTFTVEDPKDITFARLQVVADGNWQTGLNDQKLKGGAQESLKLAKVDDVLPFLRKGENVLSVQVDKLSGATGMLYELRLRHRDGREEVIVSDPQTRSSKQPDQGWVPSVISAKPPDLWGHIPYFDFSEPEEFRLMKWEFQPGGKLVAGADAKLRLEIQTPRRPRRDYAFRVWVGPGEADPAHMGLAIAEALGWPDKPTSQWPGGKTQTVEIPVHLTRLALAGEYPVKAWLSCPTGRGQWLDRAGDELGKVAVVRPSTPAMDQRVARSRNAPAKMNQPVRVADAKGQPAFWIGKQPAPGVFVFPDHVDVERMAEYSAVNAPFWHQIVWDKSVIAPPGKETEHFEQLFRLYDQAIAEILRYAPDARLMVSFVADPPAAWLDAHPSERAILGNGKPSTVSFSSELFRQVSYAGARKLIEHLEAQPFAANLMSYNPYIGRAGECYTAGVDVNFTPKRDEIILGDYSECEIQAFRGWLKEKYRGEVAALRAAWKDPRVTFETATYNNEILRKVDAPGFRDPTITRLPMDYFEFHNQTMSRFATGLGEVVKQASKNRALYGVYMGYGLSLINQTPGWSQFGGQTQSYQVIRHPAIDFLGGTSDYGRRVLGTAYWSVGFTDSLRENGKMWISECDTRTYRTPYDPSGAFPLTVEGSLRILKRDFAVHLCKGDAFWWRDMSYGKSGRWSTAWYLDEALLDCQRRCVEVAREEVRGDRQPDAEIAVFADESTCFYQDIYAGTLYNNLLWRLLGDELHRCGAPYRLYYFDDIENPNVWKRSKLFIMLNPFHISEARRALLEKKLKGSGKTVLWFYAPGYVSDVTGLKVANISQLTGIQVREDPKGAVLGLKLAPAGVQALGEAAQSKPVRCVPWTYEGLANLYSKEIAPMFRVDDPAAKVLGLYEHDGSPAFARKTKDGWTSCYLGVPFATAELIRGVAAQAGVHIYYDNSEVFGWMNRRYVGLHNRGTVQEVALNCPWAKGLREVFTGETVSSPTGQFAVKLAPFETKLFQLRAKP